MTSLQRSLPNAITVARLFLAVIFFVVISQLPSPPTGDSTAAWLAVALFTVAALTDVLDGFLARRWKVVSGFGRVLDPVVDKVLIIGSMVFLVAPPLAGGSGVEPWMLVVVIAREFLVTGLRSLAEARGIPFGADWMGKIKMFAQSLAVPFCLGQATIAGCHDSAGFCAFTRWLLWFTIAWTALSGVTPVLRFRAVPSINPAGVGK